MTAKVGRALLISYETYLGGQESCRVAVSNCSAVTGKVCTCPIRKAASADADILAFHMVVVTETNHHALLSASIRSHKSMPTALQVVEQTQTR